MITIKLEENPQKVLEDIGRSYIGKLSVMSMREGEELLGTAVAEILDGYARVLDIFIKEEFRDFSLEYGLGKALLNMVDLGGIKHAVCDNANMEKLLEALKFRRTDLCENVPQELERHSYYVNLDGYFDSNC